MAIDKTMPSFTFEPYVLSPLDHMIGPIHLSAFLTFHPGDPLDAIHALEAGVSRLATILPFLTGNITSSNRVEGKINVLEVQPATGEFLQESPMLKVRHHDKFIVPSEHGITVSYDTMLNEDFIPIPFAMAMEELSPVARCQVNVMRDGLIFCFNFNHLALDGIGVVNVLEILADCCRNPRLVSLPTDPCKEAQTRRVISEAGISLATKDEQHVRLGEYAGDLAPNMTTELPITRLFVMDAEKILYLKTACNSILQGQVETLNTPVSSNTVVSSLIWLCFIRSQSDKWSTQDSLDNEPRPDKSCLLLVQNARQKLQIPRFYLGNTSITTEAYASIDTVLSSFNGRSQGSIARKGPDVNDLAILAQLCLSAQKAIQALTVEYIRGLISRLTANDDWAAYIRPGDVSVSSIRHFPLYKLDFGPSLGSVRNFDMPENRFSGAGWVMPARFGDLSAPWELRMAFAPSVMERVQQDNLMQWVTGKEMAKL